jgi:aminopeptidase N
MQWMQRQSKRKGDNVSLRCSGEKAAVIEVSDNNAGIPGKPGQYLLLHIFTRDVRPTNYARLTTQYQMMRVLAGHTLRILAVTVAALSPAAAQQRAPERQFDLIDVAFSLTVDPKTYTFNGVVVNTLAPLHDTLSAIKLDCGARLRIDSVKVAGQAASFSRAGDSLSITPAFPLVRGKAVAVSIHYSGDSTDGFHWVKPTAQDPTRDGFWTVGQPMHNHGWLPTWDYPNDVATSQARVTVPASWYVIGNGALESDSLSKDRLTRTFRWRMSQPHATYLISLAGGSMDVKTVVHAGIPLMYVVPAGKGNLIDASFGKTPEMLSFYSKLLGVKYPWAKYSQASLRDYAGGIENVSATSFGPGILSDRRDSPDGGDPLIAHELAHQWFGNLVTYRQWGDVWLGEGFATYFGQLIFAEYWHSKVRYAQHVEDMMQQYFAESRNYRRALSVPEYLSAEAMFDDHAYLKGAVILHTLRSQLGDAVFFRSLHEYLRKYKNQSVDSRNLRDAMTTTSGVSLELFFSQWIFRPGHPVLDYAWTWDPIGSAIDLKVTQLQDTAGGTPIYSFTSRVALISGGKVTRQSVTIGKRDERVRISAAEKPDAVIFDPDHEMLRELPSLHWSTEELPHILRFAPSPVDRQEALNRLVAGNPTDSVIRMLDRVISADNGRDPVFRSVARLGEIARPELRPLFRKLISSPDADRRAQAVRAIGRFCRQASDVAKLRALVNDREAYGVIRAVVSVLGSWDPAANRDVFERAAEITSPFDAIRALSLDALARADSADGRHRKDADAELTKGINAFMLVLARGETESPLLTRRQRAQLKPEGNKTVAGWLAEMKSLTPLGCDDVRGRRIVQNNEAISTMCFYRLTRSTGAALIMKFSLNPERKVAYWANYPANY